MITPESGIVAPNFFAKAAEKTLGEKIDAYEKLDRKVARASRLLKLREERLEAAAQELLDLLKAAELTGAVGNDGATLKIERKDFPQISDHELLNAFVKDTDAFDLFQSRINSRAYKARADAGVNVPGISVFTKTTLKLKTKR